MAKAGDSTFNKILRESGGYVADHEHIRYILAHPLPDGLTFYTPIQSIRMIFNVLDKRLRSRMEIYLYEPEVNNCFAAKDIKYINFNLKVYEVVHRKPYKKTVIDGVKYTIVQLIADEI